MTLVSNKAIAKTCSRRVLVKYLRNQAILMPFLLLNVGIKFFTGILNIRRITERQLFI
ncbi:hypothetical protein D3C81_2304750 [compost metagenome]